MASSHLLLDDLFVSCLARYASILPHGIQLPHHSQTLPSLTVQILSWRPARTLYENKQPRCRSLDGIASLTDGRSCAECSMRTCCTPQIYLQFRYDQVPYRLLLAYTSARNFLSFYSRLRDQAVSLKQANVRLSVRDRGRWGELLFSCSPQHNRP